MGQENTKQNLFIKIIQGQTQSHQLFDFQTGGFEQQQKVITSPSYIINKGETVQYIDQKLQNALDYTSTSNFLYKLTQNQFKQILIKDLGSDRVLWRVIKPEESHLLKPGDILKIGKIKIQLKRIVEKKSQQIIDDETVKQQQQQGLNYQTQSIKSGHSSCDRCRICFRSFNNKTDPLLCLCKCAGSIKFIHFLCLKDWISNNISKRQDQNCKFYSYSEICCELCKFPLPNQFKHDGRQYFLFNFTTFQPPYAEFQYSQMQNNKKKFYKYVINLQKDKQVVVGRNNSSQVVMKDISISRMHCSLQYKHGMLLVRDKKSKFGTLVKIDKSIQFSSENGLQLQFQSKIIELYQKNSFKNCCCSDIDNYKIIFEQAQSIPVKNMIPMNCNELHVEQQLQIQQSRLQVRSQASLNNRNNSARLTMVRENPQSSELR